MGFVTKQKQQKQYKSRHTNKLKNKKYKEWSFHSSSSEPKYLYIPTNLSLL